LLTASYCKSDNVKKLGQFDDKEERHSQGNDA
jgi:hypothetical protein